MPLMFNRLRSLTIAVAFVLAVAACGGAEPDADRVSLSLTTSPINDLLGVDIALRSGDVAALEQEAELLVAECMLNNGFTYVPIDFASQLPVVEGNVDPDSREFAETNGYGISIRPEAPALNPEDVLDPNEEIRAQLSPAELEAYQQALFGERPAEGETPGLDEQTGCVAESYREVSDAQAALGSVGEFFDEFSSELTELEDRFRADPRFLELERTWAECMFEQGFGINTRDELFVELDRRMAEVSTGLAPGEEPDASTQALMEEVRDWERRAAVADWDCTQPVQEDMQTLRYGYEALFLEENQDRLTPDS